MTRITKETAATIAYAYSEIEAAEELLKIITDAKSSGEAPDFRDVFGRRRLGIQIGIPSGDSSRRLMDVSTSLAAIVIKAHIEAKQSEIDALCKLASGEMGAGK